MLHMKFDQEWPTGLRDIQVQKCGGRRQRTTDHWYTQARMQNQGCKLSFDEKLHDF